MSNNQNDPKQLDCNLCMQATAAFQQEIENDLSTEDSSLAEILGKDEQEDGNETVKDDG